MTCADDSSVVLFKTSNNCELQRLFGPFICVCKMNYFSCKDVILDPQPERQWKDITSRTTVITVGAAGEFPEKTLCGVGLVCLRCFKSARKCDFAAGSNPTRFSLKRF